jgi:hypothetical protein
MMPSSLLAKRFCSGGATFLFLVRQLRLESGLFVVSSQEYEEEHIVDVDDHSKSWSRDYKEVVVRGLWVFSGGQSIA